MAKSLLLLSEIPKGLGIIFAVRPHTLSASTAVGRYHLDNEDNHEHHDHIIDCHHVFEEYRKLCHASQQCLFAADSTGWLWSQLSATFLRCERDTNNPNNPLYRFVKKQQSTGEDDGCRNSGGLGNADNNCRRAASYRQRQQAAVDTATVCTIFWIKQLAGGWQQAATVVRVASTLETSQIASTAIVTANLKVKASINGVGNIKQQTVEPTSATAHEWWQRPQQLGKK